MSGFVELTAGDRGHAQMIFYVHLYFLINFEGGWGKIEHIEKPLKL